jgi:S-adenosylmethionine hydrolase
MMPTIVLLTDFGHGSPYVGEMKGVIASLAPGVAVLDLSHDVRPQDVREGAFLLGEGWRRFPRGSVFVAVVDPGVGSERAIVALQARGAVFLAPDNGLLSHVWRELVSRETRPAASAVSRETPWRLFTVSNRRLFLPRVSATFHGRDVFAPVAARLARGLPLHFVGPRRVSLSTFPESRPEPLRGGGLRGQVVYVDRYGNLITDLRSADLPPGDVHVTVAGRTIAGLSPSYAAGPELLAIVDAWDRLEIARQNGSAAEFLNVRVGSEIVVRGNEPQMNTDEDR